MSHPDFRLTNGDGAVVWEGDDRKAIKSLDLAEGEYLLWKFQGVLPVRVVPAKRTVTFQSANPKGPRKAKAPEAATGGPTGDPLVVTGEAIG